MKIEELKLLVIDLDGTMLNNQGRFSELSERVLNYLLNHGVTILMATGRGYVDASFAFNETKLDMQHDRLYLSAYNGAQLKHCATKQTLYVQSIDKKLLRVFMDDLSAKFSNLFMLGFGYRNNDYNLTYCLQDAKVTDDVMANVLDEYAKIIANLNALQFRQTKLEKWLEFDLLKFVIYGSEQSVQQARVIAAKSFSTTMEPGIFDKNLYVSELGAMGVNKLKPIVYLAKKMQISLNDNVICFGNESNDVAMLENVRHSIVMCNARDEIKSSATFESALSNDEDGVAWWLINYFDLRIYR